MKDGPVVIARDDQGRHYFVKDEIEQWKGKRTYPEVAIVTCERGHMAVLDGRLVHAVQGKHPDYEADWLLRHAADPPEGLQIELLEWET